MKILVAGDFRPVFRVAECFEKDDFESVLREVKPIVENVDYSIVNFESPVVEHDAKPIVKCGPNLKCTTKGVEALKWTGFNCVTLANNHFLDYGEIGVRDTINACRKYGIDTVGGGMDMEEASKILYKDIDGQKLAIINCCEHEFSIATKDTPGSNPLNPIKQYYKIKEAREKADFVLVITHGGHEHFQLPSPRMVETYRFFVDAGADAVVNHHQHCYSGYEVYNGKPIFYGLGNFCYEDKGVRNTPWNEGYMVIVEVKDASVDFNILPYNQCNGDPQVKMLNEGAFENCLPELNTIIADKEKLSKAINDYYDSIDDVIGNVFEPIQNRYYLAAKIRGYFPSFLNKKHILKIKNNVVCEAHNDKLTYWLKKHLL